MSRCFPFPPPGYEKKTRTEDLDLLKKEKHREKKHKKEKRDREKKEGKGKQEKDRSYKKHRDKKGKKEKHRDKTKDKEKNRDTDKNNHVISDENKLFGQEGAYKRKSDEKSKNRGKDKSTVSGEKVMGHSVYNGVVLGKNSHLALQNKNFKHLHELGNKIAIEEGKRSNLETRKDVGIPRMGVSSPATPLAISERSKERKVSDEKMDRHGPGVEARPSENVVQKFAEMAQNRVEGMARLAEKNADWRMGMKEKVMVKEGDDIKGDKRKDENIEKFQKYKEKGKVKEKRKEEKLKEMGREKLVEQSRVKDSNKVHADQFKGKDVNKNDKEITQSARFEKLPNESNKSAAVPENLRKRKEFGPNGVSYDDDIGPNKVARTTCSSHPMTQNGRSLQPSQNSTTFAPDRQHSLSTIKLDGKDRRVNGTIDSHQSASRPSQATGRVDQNPGPVKKLPHPDTRYLAQVLSVPKIEDWSEFDDQEWLFCSNHSPLSKSNAETSRFDDTPPQVWSEALRIESVDLFALPYVIPH